MHKDQVTGRVEQAKGAIKEVAGKVVGNESLEAKGKVQKTAGKAKAAVGDIKSDAKAIVNDVKAAVKKRV